MARCYVNLGAAQLAEREKEEARTLYVELGEEYTSHDERALWWCQTNGAAWLLIRAGDFVAAENLFRNSAEQAAKHRDPGFSTIGDETLVDAYIGLGDSLLLQTKYEEAGTAYGQALNAAEEFGSLWLAARADLSLANLTGVTKASDPKIHLDAGRRRLSFMGLEIEDIFMHDKTTPGQTS